MSERPTQRRSKQLRDTGTRDELLRAAASCVRAHGLVGVTSREIAAAAGANLAAITYHFGSKDDLIAEALFTELQRRLAPALAVLRSEGDQVAVMLQAVQQLIADFETSRVDAPLYLEALVAATRPGAYATMARRLVRKVRGLIAEQLRVLHADGLVPQWVEPDAMAALIVSVANGIALQVSIEPRGPGHAAIAGQFVSLLVSARG